MDIMQNSYVPGDPILVDRIVSELKSQGIFDHFRKECIADVDTKPAYQNLRQRVEGSVSSFLKKQTWKPDINKNQVRELLRKSIHESGFLETGVERIVDQVVNPKINTVFLPQVEDVVYKFLGIEKPSRNDNKSFDPSLKLNVIENLLPTDLEAISPYSDIQDDELNDANENAKDEKAEKAENATNNTSEIMQEDVNNSKIDEDESPPFEPLEESVTLMAPEENSIDSHLSGISGLASHDSNHSQEKKTPPVDICSQDSQISKHSSEEPMSFSPSDDNDTKMEVCEDSRYSKSSKSRDSSTKFEFSQDSQSNSDKSLMAEKKQDVKKDYKSRDKYKSSKSDKKDSRDKDKDRKSESRDRKDRHSSSKDSKSSKDKKDSKSCSNLKSDSRNEKEKTKNKDSTGRNSSSSRDKSSSGSKKESHSKDKTLDVKDKEKSKASNAKEHDKDSKPKEKNDTKNSHLSRHSSDKHKKDDKRKHSSSSHQKHKKDDKKESRKDPKDDHFSSKQGKHGRRSTDRDSNDGRSSQKGPSNFTLDSTSSAESQKQESSGSNSGSVDSGNSETDAVETVNQLTDLQRVKIIKPKFASNIHEARRLMKIRKELDKIEKRNQLSLDLATNNSLLLVSKLKTTSNGLLDAMNLEDVHIAARESWTLEEKSKDSSEMVPPPLVNSVIMKDSIEALEAKLGEEVINDDCDDYEESKKIASNEKNRGNEINCKAVEQDKIKNEKAPCDTLLMENCCSPADNVKNTYEHECIGFEKSITPEIQRYLKYASLEIQRLEHCIELMSSENVHSSSLPLLETSPRQNVKRKRNPDAKNNNKKLFNHKHLIEDEHTIASINCGKVKKTRKSTGIVTAFNDSFLLPLSPAESEKSVERKVEFNEKIKKNAMSLKATQRYSSDDLYKPRPFFSGSRRRRRNLNVEVD